MNDSAANMAMTAANMVGAGIMPSKVTFGYKFTVNGQDYAYKMIVDANKLGSPGDAFASADHILLGAGIVDASGGVSGTGNAWVVGYNPETETVSAGYRPFDINATVGELLPGGGTLDNILPDFIKDANITANARVGLYVGDLPDEGLGSVDVTPKGEVGISFARDLSSSGGDAGQKKAMAREMIDKFGDQLLDTVLGPGTAASIDAIEAAANVATAVALLAGANIPLAAATYLSKRQVIEAIKDQAAEALAALPNGELTGGFVYSESATIGYNSGVEVDNPGHIEEIGALQATMGAFLGQIEGSVQGLMGAVIDDQQSWIDQLREFLFDHDPADGPAVVVEPPVEEIYPELIKILDKPAEQGVLDIGSTIPVRPDAEGAVEVNDPFGEAALWVRGSDEIPDPVPDLYDNLPAITYTPNPVYLEDGENRGIHWQSEDWWRPYTFTGTERSDTFSGDVGAVTAYGYGSADTFFGGAGDDKFYGGDGNDSLYAGGFGAVYGSNSGGLSGAISGGNNLLDGGAGDDYFVGGYGNDRMYGGTGNDIMLAETGNDYIDGGAGLDVVIYTGDLISTMQYTGSTGYTSRLEDYNIIKTGDGRYEISRWDGLGGTDTLVDVERIQLGITRIDNDGFKYRWAKQYRLEDVISHDPIAVDDTGYSVAQGQSLAFSPEALLDNDSDEFGDELEIYTVQDAVNGSLSLADGYIVFTPTDGYSGSASFSYTIGDSKTGEATATVYIDVNDYGTVAIDRLSDRLFGTENVDGSDSFSGYAGTIWNNGTSGDDTLNGGDGNDVLFGGDGDDKLYGGAGNDTLNGDAGNDEIYGDAGRDLIFGGTGNDKLYGGAGNDWIAGNTGNDRLFGGAGNDTLLGGAGNDSLRGGSGRDRIEGGAGHDYMDGGAGNYADTFVFRLNDGNDRIGDFQDGLDMIEFQDTGMSFDDLQIINTRIGTLILTDANDAILLIWVDASLITADDFIFTGGDGLFAD